MSNYRYDGNGNQIAVERMRKSTADGNGLKLGIFEASGDNGYGYEKYIYNGFNQMTSAVAEDGTVTKYTYGCDGIRTSKKVGNNQTVYFELDRGNVFKEAYADGTAVQKYLWGAGLVGNGKGEFYLKNGHGDVVQIVNSSFEVKDNYAYEYDAFGNNINKRNGDTNPFRYCSDNR